VMTVSPFGRTDDECCGFLLPFVSYREFSTIMTLYEYRAVADTILHNLWLGDGVEVSPYFCLTYGGAQHHNFSITLPTYTQRTGR